MHVEKMTPKDLAGLLRLCDDDVATHVIWVSPDGELHISPLLEQGSVGKVRTRGREGVDEFRPLTPAGWAKKNAARIQFRLESCVQGTGQVGPNAADDPSHVGQIYRLVVEHWAAGTTGLVDAHL